MAGGTVGKLVCLLVEMVPTPDLRDTKFEVVEVVVVFTAKVALVDHS